jgi:1-acyl-sn-glycerol-3-phosphate acyltransferase
MDVPCLPIALNSGVFWPRRSLKLRKGTIVVDILEPIAPGLDRQDFFTQLQTKIEDASDRLVIEAHHSLQITD